MKRSGQGRNPLQYTLHLMSGNVIYITFVWDIQDIQKLCAWVRWMDFDSDTQYYRCLQWYIYYYPLLMLEKCFMFGQKNYLQAFFVWENYIMVEEAKTNKNRVSSRYCILKLLHEPNSRKSSHSYHLLGYHCPYPP